MWWAEISHQFWYKLWMYHILNTIHRQCSCSWVKSDLESSMGSQSVHRVHRYQCEMGQDVTTTAKCCRLNVLRHNNTTSSSCVTQNHMYICTLLIHRKIDVSKVATCSALHYSFKCVVATLTLSIINCELAGVGL